MKLHLQALQQEDPATIFICRRINALGLNSAERLRQHFSRYGEVKGVFVSHSHVKCTRAVRGSQDADLGGRCRLRAASLGFVVMMSAEATSCILQEGPAHTIRGIAVSVDVFQRRTLSSELPEGTVATPGQPDGDQEHVSGNDRQHPQRMFLAGMSALQELSVEELQDAVPQFYED
jgi:hypothetical protein